MAPTPPIFVSTDDFTPLTLQRSDTEKTWEDVVREVSHSRMEQELDSDETGTRDSDFRLSKLDDLKTCISTDEAQDNLDRYLPSKIVLEARSKCHDYRRQGLDEDASEALEGGLQLLDNDLGDGSDIWELNKCEILLDLGEKAKAQAILAVDRAHTNGHMRSGLNMRPSQNRRKSQNLHLNTTDAQYEEMIRYQETTRQRTEEIQDQQQRLDVALRAEAWDQVKLAATEMKGLDESYFDYKKPMDRFAKIRQLLNIGYLAEREAMGYVKDPMRMRTHLELALRTYNHGCHATDLFHRLHDGPNSQVYDYDHVDCANLFFSAARVCISFQENQERFLLAKGELVTPVSCKLEPELSEGDWNQQALNFLEQGRSRALLDSIARGEDFVPSFQKALLENVVYAAQAIIRIKKRDSLVAASAPQSRAVSPMDTPPRSFKFPDLRDLAPLSAPIEGVERLNDPRKRRVTLDGASNRPLLYESEPSSPATPGPVREAITAEHLRKLKVQMRWRKALLYAFSEINPTFNAAAAALPNSRIKRFPEISKSIPPDALILEYGLPSSAPSGLVTLLIGSDGVKAALWKETSVIDIKAQIKTLRHKMAQETSRARRDATVSPVSPKSARSVPDLDKSVEELRDALYNSLVRPIKTFLTAQDAKRLIIIPSGELAHVPWGMLLELPFSVVPSLSIWHRLHENSAVAPMVRRPNVSVFSNRPRDKQGVSRDIPFSRIEALYLSSLHSQLPALADDCDRIKFEVLSKNVQILHLCAHSSFDDHDPTKSSVQLFDQPWTITQWRDFAIKADIVIFSSCLSAISKAYDSGSTFGFAHTLLASGTRAFIGSLWPVEDAPTLLLMMLFYQELRVPHAPADALHIAQSRLRDLGQEELWDLVELLKIMFKKLGVTARDYVNNPPYWIKELECYDVTKLRDPRCWAAFILTGYGFRAVYPPIGAMDVMSE